MYQPVTQTLLDVHRLGSLCHMNTRIQRNKEKQRFLEPFLPALYTEDCNSGSLENHEVSHIVPQEIG